MVPSEERRIVFNWIEHALSRTPNHGYSTSAAGTGFNLEELRRRGVPHAIGLDIGTEALAHCHDVDWRRSSVPMAAGSHSKSKASMS